MPLPKRATKPRAPDDRVYKAPIPKEQKRFPERRKRVTYGKSAGPRIPKPEVQTTLTQIYWVDQPEEDQGTEDPDYVQNEEAKRKKKRRRTMGDEHEEAKAAKHRRRTLGDESVSSSRFHTQTLTQWDRSFSAADEEEADIFKEDLEAALLLPSAMRNDEGQGIARGNLQLQMNTLAEVSTESGDTGPTRTPRSRRTFEIPSTQSPASPDSDYQSFGRSQSPLSKKSFRVFVESEGKDSIMNERTKKRVNIPGQREAQCKWVALQPIDPSSKRRERRALQEQSINIRSVHNKPKIDKPKLRIEDTYETDLETQQSRVPSSPSKPSNQLQSVRFQMKYAFTDEKINSDEGVAQQLLKLKPSTRTIFKTEISDSEDDESDLEIESQFHEGIQRENKYKEERNLERSSSIDLALDNFTTTVMEEDPPETQALRSNSDNHNNEDIVEEGRVEEGVLQRHKNFRFSPEVEETSEDRSESPVQQLPETCYDDFSLETQMHLEDAEYSLPPLKENAFTRYEKDTILLTQVTTRSSRTQGMESQRLSTQHVDAMAPRFYGSDVFISMHSQQVTEIVTQKRNHHFTSRALQPKTSRIWLYETAPVCLLKYMAVISSALHPGELQDERGIGNSEFNAGKSKISKYAYEILEVYELADPLSFARLQESEWLDKAPRNELVRPAVIDHLMANLKPPLFTTSEKELAGVSSSSSDTQEVEAQLIHESTQFHQSQTQRSSSPAAANEYTKQVTATSASHHDSSPIPSSFPLQLPQMTSIRNATRSPYQSLHNSRPFIRSSQATTVDLTQTQITPARPGSRGSDVEIVFESPVHKHVLSSTPPSHFEGEDGSNVGSDMLVPYSTDSVQLLTKSQLLPDSLLTESVPPPPRFVYDSQDDEDEDDENYDDI